MFWFIVNYVMLRGDAKNAALKQVVQGKEKEYVLDTDIPLHCKLCNVTGWRKKVSLKQVVWGKIHEAF